MKRRKLVVLLTVFLLVFALCACGGSGGEGEGNSEVSTEQQGSLATESAVQAVANTTTGGAAAASVGSAASKEKGFEKNEEEKKIGNVTPKGNTVTFSIDCSTILDNLDSLDPSKVSIVPEDGWIMSPEEVAFEEGETVFDLLLRLTKDRKIHMEFTKTPALNTNYVEGIANLYEFDCGELSGWTYKVNGEVLGTGSSNTKLGTGDIVEWRYTCDQGRDVGGPEI